MATILPRDPAHFFDGAPLHLREKMREDAQFRVAENYLLSGLGRHAPEEDVDLAVRSLFALSVQLGDKPFLMGETPCGMDATAFGALAGILTPFFEFAAAAADRAVRQSHRLCRPDDAAVLSGIRLGAGAASKLRDHCVADAGWPFNAASSASSSAMRASRTASACATSAASNFCGMCCGQLVSHAAIRNRITCSGRAL